MFINLDGEVFHVLLQGEVGAWVISCDVYGMPVYLDQQHLERAERIPTPEEYVRNRQRKISEPQKERYRIIEEMVKDPLWSWLESQGKTTLLDTNGRRTKNDGGKNGRKNSLLCQGKLTGSKPGSTD